MQTADEPAFVSVVVPVYNRARLITRALESVHDQTFRPIELIVVDDGSTDTTRSVAEEWAADHETADFHVVVISEVNRGAAAARNVGIQAANGEWVAFLDSDDWWEPEKLAVCHAAIEVEQHYGMWYSASRWVEDSEKGVIRVVSRGSSGSHREPLKKSNPIAAFSSVMVQREVLLAVGGFDEQMPARQDVDLYYRLSEQIDFGFIPHMLVNVDVTSSNRISSSLTNRMNGWILFCEKHKGSLSVIEKLYHQKRILWYALQLRDLPVVLRYGIGGLAHYVWKVLTASRRREPEWLDARS